MKYVFKAFFDDECYHNDDAFTVIPFDSFEKMKVFSAAHSEFARKFYPKYVSSYTKVENDENRK